MQKHNLAAQPIELHERTTASASAVAEVQAPEIRAQEEHKLQNAQREWEHPQEKAQRLVPGFDLKRFYL